MNKENINNNQKKFLEHYATTLDCLKSARLAGYKSANALSAAKKILDNNQKLAILDKIIDSNAQKLNITRAFIIKKYLKIIDYAFFEDENGLKDPQLALRALDGLCKQLGAQKIENFSTTKSIFEQIEGLDVEKI